MFWSLVGLPRILQEEPLDVPTLLRRGQAAVQIHDVHAVHCPDVRRCPSEVDVHSMLAPVRLDARELDALGAGVFLV